MVVMAAIALNIYFLLFISFVDGRSQTQIELGSSLFPMTYPTSWDSPSGQFEFGFYHQSNGYALGILLISKTGSTVVWTANRDDPPVTSNAKLQLTKDGKLLLQNGHGQKKLIANVSASSASMLDSGNFVLFNKNSSVIWQSFDYPTDTILGAQILPTGSQLVSSSSETNQSSGRFRLKMQDDGNLVQYPVNTGDTAGDAYWSTDTYAHGFLYHLDLNKTGSLLIVNNINSTTKEIFSYSSLSSANSIYRATLDSDGVFRLYSHDIGSETVSILWASVDNTCEVYNTCGSNSYCINNINHQAYCNCIPGSDFINPSQTTLGCKRNFSDAECRGGKANATFYHLSTVQNIRWDYRPYFEAATSKKNCQLSCLEDCNCGVAFYDDDDGVCKKQALPLRYVMMERYSQSMPLLAFFKVGTRSLKIWNATPPIPEPDQPPPINTTSNRAIVQIVLIILCFAFLLCSTITISSHLIYKIGVFRYKRLLEIGDLGLNEGVTLRVFSYNELKRATNGFKEELGKGSFGAVYKGTINKGRTLVAVKRLEKLIEEGEGEFKAEMRAIGKSHHRNLVRLLGYCAEGSNRLLVYEYMSNGSLGNLLFRNVRRPDWDERRRIALDVARGILYLHEECEAPIIHCDIKPQNILMDEFWTAKISDFGLAKLLLPDQTRTFTEVRGTRGYLAPEWQKNTPISVKADVYSYGIMLLEIVFCRRHLEINILEPEQIVLSSWIYKLFNARELKKFVLGEPVDENLLENMVKVALWCIQDEPFLRPTMKSVVLMLEGVTDVAIPPCPSANFM